MNKTQSTSLILHNVDNHSIHQRVSDGYINATAMCLAANKRFQDYRVDFHTQAYRNALALELGIPADSLIQEPQKLEFWVHPDVAINLAQWLSPKFAVQVGKWVREWVSSAKGTVPYHLKRYMANKDQVPYTHFSILNELAIGLIAPLETAGYTLPDNMLPDISEGRMFAKWLREEKNIDTDAMPTYTHTYSDGRTCTPKMYPTEYLGDFRKHFHEVWLPKKAISYFEERDVSALPFLNKLPAIASANEKLKIA